MKRHPIHIISKKQIIIPLLVLCLAAIVGWYLLKKEESKTLGNSQLFSQVMMKGLEELQDRWELGDIEQNFSKERIKCPEYIAQSKSVGQEYLQCNRLYLECFFAGKVGLKYQGIQVRLDDHEYQIKAIANKNGKYTELSRDGEVILNLQVEQIPNLQLTVKLQNTCADTFLPEGIYAPGTSEQSDQTWDNVGQKIYVDKHYVSIKDVNEWVDAAKIDEISQISDPELFPTPAVNLNWSQREKYCAFRGKQLLASHVLDAASFIPDTSFKEQDRIFKYPYYWTRNKHESFLWEKSQMRKGEVTSDDCAKAMVAECKNKALIVHFPPDPLSWMGIKYPLGYYPESVANYFDPSKNLVPSSFYFPANSPVHQLGFRGQWDGEGFDQSNISIPGVELEHTKIDRFQIAFRCMKLVSQ